MNGNQKLTHVVAGRVVAGVDQQGAAMHVRFTDGSVLLVKLEDEASSVMVRGAKGEMQYAD